MGMMVEEAEAFERAAFLWMAAFFAAEEIAAAVSHQTLLLAFPQLAVAIWHDVISWDC
jgi:hypothetical protein